MVEVCGSSPHGPTNFSIIGVRIAARLPALEACVFLPVCSAVAIISPFNDHNLLTEVLVSFIGCAVAVVMTECANLRPALN
jgi:hypothetical protein